MKYFDKLPEQKQFEFLVNKIELQKKKLGNVENNLQYIKCLKSLQLWLIRFDNFCHFHRAYFNCKEWKKLFSDLGFSYADRVWNSIQEYNCGNKPF